MDCATSLIPTDVAEQIKFVASYVGDVTTDWSVVKIQLLSNVGNTSKKLFSRRHYATKKQYLNDFELEVIRLWKQFTGIELQLSPEKKHNLKWVKRPVGWALNGGKKKLNDGK